MRLKLFLFAMLLLLLPVQAISAAVTNESINEGFKAIYHDDKTVTVEGIAPESAGMEMKIMIQGPRGNVTFSEDYMVQVDTNGYFKLTTEPLGVSSVNIYVYAKPGYAYYLGVRDRSTLSDKPVGDTVTDLKSGDPLLQYTIQDEGIAEIKEKWKLYAPTYNFANSGSPYVEEPLLVSPYRAGALKQEILLDSLNMTKFVRYLAGMSEDITLDDEYTQSAQHKVVILEKTYTADDPHYPPQPSDMDDSFYEIGKISGYENLHYGYDPTGAVVSFMDDWGTKNMYSVGHRRAILKPDMQSVGFGYTSNYAVMRMKMNKETAYSTPDYIAWPSAGNFPIEMANVQMFSIQLNPDKYANIDQDKVVIEIVNKGQKKKWLMYDTGLYQSNNGPLYFSEQRYVNDYGSFITFRPDDLTIKLGDEINVKITGVRDLNDQEVTIDYTMRFFDLDNNMKSNAESNSFGNASEWALTELSAASEKGLVAPVSRLDFNKAITREQFSEVVMKFYEALTGDTVQAASSNPFTDTTNSEVLKAYKLGIVKGITDDSFAPNQSIKREEIAVMLNRALEKALPNQASGQANSSFVDKDKFSPWAIEAIQNLSRLGVVQGDSNNLFNPKSNTTVEQACIMAYRLLVQVSK